MDQERFHREFLQHQAMLQDFVHLLVPDVHDAEDLFQDLGVVILGKTTGLPRAEDFPRWARGVARNLVRHYWRQRGRRREQAWEDFAWLADRSFDEAPLAADLRSQQRQALAACIDRTAREDRRLLRQHYGQGQPLVTIARQYGSKAATLRVQLSRLRRRLLACIRQRLATAR